VVEAVAWLEEGGAMRLGHKVGWLVLLALVAPPAWGAAPPAPSGRLTPDQQRRLDQLERAFSRATFAGEMVEAVRLARQAEALRRRWQGPGHWQAVDARYLVERWERLARLKAAEQKEVGRALLRESEAQALQARHRYAEAEKAHRDVLALRRKTFGENHPETAQSYNILAFNLHAQGKHGQAQPLYEKALDLYRKLLGEDHPDTALSYNNLASCLNAQGQQGQAQPLYEKALDLYRKLLGEDHPETALSYNSVAFNLHAQGKHDQAQPLFQKALDLRNKLLGEEHPDTVLSYSNLAANLNAQGKHGQAQPLFQKALDLHRKLLGEDHPDTALSYNNLAANLAAQGKHAQAQPLYEKALDLNRKLLDEEHLSTALSYNNLAMNLAAQGRHPQAQPLFQKALDLHRKLLGEERSLTAASYNNLAFNLNAQGKHAQAQPLYQKALDLRKKLLGEEHPATASSYNNLASCLDAQGKHGLARPLFEKALDLRKKVLGEEHPDTATSYNNLAANLHAQGKHGQARPLFEKALELRKKLLGEEHPDTAQSSNNLAANLHAQGKAREAIQAWESALLGHDAGRLARASSGFDRALLGADRLTPRQGLAVAHARLKEPRRAWQYAEADLARALLDDRGKALAESATLLAQVDSLDRRLLLLLASASLSEDQKRLRQELTEQRRGLLKRLAGDLAASAGKRVWPLERIQKQLPADAALLLWVSALGENWGCVLRAQGPPHWQRLAGSGPGGTWTPEDYQQPARLRAALADRSSSIARRRKLTAAVRRRWLAPLAGHRKAEDKLPAVRRLFVVPSGYLAGLPVEVLAPEWTVSYVPSGTLLAQALAGHRPLRASAALALGDPAFTATGPPVPPEHGLLITRVLPGSWAARAGLVSGDVLHRYGGARLTTVADLAAALKKAPKAEAVVWREGKERTVTLGSPLGVRVDRRPAEEAVPAWRALHQPVVRGPEHKALPGTRREVKALRRLLGEGCQVLLGSDASEQRLDALARSGELKRFRVLHLATHGQVDLGDPSRSALILARDELSAEEQAERASKGLRPFTGELTVGAVLEGWKLDCDLVVLSACETALGKKSSGDGLLGFTQAFLKVGARSVVLSLWQVDDEATALLMVRFYQNLLGKRPGLKPMPKAEALAEARDWLRNLSASQVKVEVERLRGKGTKPVPERKEARPFAHPYYWAAFVLIGDPR
jgi:tetratricopeptide (TPR) repeat protein